MFCMSVNKVIYYVTDKKIHKQTKNNVGCRGLLAKTVGSVTVEVSRRIMTDSPRCFKKSTSVFPYKTAHSVPQTTDALLKCKGLSQQILTLFSLLLFSGLYSTFSCRNVLCLSSIYLHVLLHSTVYQS